MLKPRILPCLDVDEGRVVKGVRFAALRDCGDPAERAALYEAQGADELVVLDVSATRHGRAARADTVRAVREKLSIPLTVGGGVRDVDDVRALLEAGADKVAVNSAAVARPELVAEMARTFGRQCTVLAVDARTNEGRYEVLVRSGSQAAGRDAVEWAREAQALGAGEILLTSFDRDGTREGYDLELLAAVRAAVDVPLIASGGAAHARHLHEALAVGADAVLAASLFHDHEHTVDEIKRELETLGWEMRR